MTDAKGHQLQGYWKRMEILFIDQFSVMGGAQLCLLDVLDAVEKRAWNAHIALPGDGPLVERVRSRGVGVTKIPCGAYRSGNKSLADFFRLPLDIRRQKRILTEIINRGNFGVIYVNGPRLLPAAALAARDRVPVLFHAHNRLNQGYAAGLAGWSIRHSETTVIACSNYVAQPLARYVKKRKLHVIPNGTPDAGFQERAFGPGRSWRIGLIGRISPEKGQAEFLQSISTLAPEFPAAKFVICGAPIIPAGKYLDFVSELARGLPVEFLGWRDDIASVLAELDLLVVPSKDEGMGRVIVEAFSAGVPVVAFATGGIPEVITDGETGFLVADATPDALAARIRAIILSDAETVRRVVANARRRWEQSYAVSSYQARIMEVVEQVGLAWRAEHETAAPPEHK
jgi:glycosyltransferase involved in cell wall biosynthesis